MGTAPHLPPFPPFSEVAERLLDNGYSPLPVKPKTKRVVEKNWTRFCLEPVDDATMARWLGCHANWGTGLATGRLIGIDIDILDDHLAFEAERRARATFGDTPLIRIGKAPKRMLFYRASTPFPTMKADPVEVLGIGRQAVAFAIHRDTGSPYVWPDETPLGVPLDRLPAITEEQARKWIEAVGRRQQSVAASRPRGIVAEKGFRHDTLFPLIRKAGLMAESEDGLVAHALHLNSAVCSPPLPTSMVMAMARGVWKYKMRGTLWADDGLPRALLTAWEFDALADEPEAIALLVFLKLNHGARDEDFAIVPDAMAEYQLLGDWGKKRYMRSRDILLERGLIERTHEGGGRGNPHLYRLTDGKGSLGDHNIKEILPPSSCLIIQQRSLFQVRYHLDGSTTVTAGSELTLFDMSTLPLHPIERLRQDTRAMLKMSPRGTQTKLAAALGVSGPHVSHFLARRRRLNRPSEALLRELISGKTEDPTNDR